MKKYEALYSVGDVLTNQQGHLRVILLVNSEDKKLTRVRFELRY